MTRIFCAAMDCEFNGDDGKCHAKDVSPYRVIGGQA